MWHSGILKRLNTGDGRGARAVRLAQWPALLPFGKGGRIDRLDGAPPSLPEKLREAAAG